MQAALRRILPSINLEGMQRVVYLRYGPALLAQCYRSSLEQSSIRSILGEFVDQVDNSQNRNGISWKNSRSELKLRDAIRQQ